MQYVTITLMQYVTITLIANNQIELRNYNLWAIVLCPAGVQWRIASAHLAAAVGASKASNE